MSEVKLSLLITKVKEMNLTDFANEQIVSKRITRSKYHYKPISLAELLLTIVLFTFLGVGLYVPTIINAEKNLNTQRLLLTVEQN